MKIIINKCFGGFGFSPLAYVKYAEKKGINCYFFEMDLNTKKYKSITLEDAQNSFLPYMFNVENPNDYNLSERDDDGTYTTANSLYNKISINIDRTDPIAISVLEEIGKLANTKYSDLKIVEIPDDIDYEIDEYDGIESIHEKHRIWE